MSETTKGRAKCTPANPTEAHQSLARYISEHKDYIVSSNDVAATLLYHNEWQSSPQRNAERNTARDERAGNREARVAAAKAEREAKKAANAGQREADRAAKAEQREADRTAKAEARKAEQAAKAEAREAVRAEAKAEREAKAVARADEQAAKATKRAEEQAARAAEKQAKADAKAADAADKEAAKAATPTQLPSNGLDGDDSDVDVSQLPEGVTPAQPTQMPADVGRGSLRETKRLLGRKKVVGESAGSF